jgi:long-chain acyl-CoA synthetase
VVPLYVTDNPENIAYILRDSDARALLVRTSEQWQALAPLRARFPGLARVLCIERATTAVAGAGIELSFVPDWLPGGAPAMSRGEVDAYALATIVYTSGTTGRPKGVMLSHYNILCNVEAALKLVAAYREDLFLSFLPLSHAFERTVGYYLPIMTGSTVAFARSAQELAQDLLDIRPTLLVSVPRIYERFYARLQQGLQKKGFAARALFARAEDIGWKRFDAAQGRGAAPGLLENLSWPLLRRLAADQVLARLGGRLRLALTEGAPLPPRLARSFIRLGDAVAAGYGLMEAAPIVSGNLIEDNVPDSVGVPLPGSNQTRRPGRASGARPQRHAGLLEPPPGYARGDRRRRLAAHRRPSEHSGPPHLHHRAAERNPGDVHRRKNRAGRCRNGHHLGSPVRPGHGRG